jgi:uncharacterized protein (DUF305 family)
MMRTSVLPAAVLRRGVLSGAAVAATLVLAACGGGDSSSSAGSDAGGTTMAPSAAPAGAATFNDADVTFAQSMIVHHQQAIHMAEMASDRAASSQVKDLAAKIKAAQQPEIDTMTGWLTAWGKPTTAPSGSAMNMGSPTASSMPGMGSGSMPDMMSDADMNKLMAAKGAAFDKMFLTMMISHHQGAVRMSQQESKQGSNPDAVALAKKIITDQQAQITEMKSMLTTL